MGDLNLKNVEKPSAALTLNTVEPLSVAAARTLFVNTRAAIFESLIDGCLKHKIKEKRKTGPRPGLRLNYDVKIGPKPGPRGVKKSRALSHGSTKTIKTLHYACQASRLCIMHARTLCTFHKHAFL